MDQHWAAQTRLPISNIQEMRKAAGLPEDGGAWIEDLDVMTLKHLGQVLLVVRRGICLTAHVLQKSPNSFNQVWILNEVPKYSELGGLGPGEKICSVAPVKAKIHAKIGSMIVVDIPVFEGIGQQSVPMRGYAYSWNGSTYEPVADQKERMPSLPRISDVQNKFLCAINSPFKPTAARESFMGHRVITDDLRQRRSEHMRQRLANPDFYAAAVEGGRKARLNADGQAKALSTRLKNMYPEPAETGKIILPPPSGICKRCVAQLQRHHHFGRGA